MTKAINSIYSLTIVDKKISLYKAAKTFVKHIKHFFNLMATTKSSSQWIINKIMRTAIKECSPKRPTTKQVLGAVYA